MPFTPVKEIKETTAEFQPIKEISEPISQFKPEKKTDIWQMGLTRLPATTTPSERAFAKAEFISPPTPLPEKIIGGIKRKGAIVAKGLLEDIPFARHLLPKKIKRLKPGPTSEKVLFPLTRFGRDIAIIGGTSGLAAGLGKYKYLKYAPDFVRGATFGALTAGTEDPEKIAKRAATTGTFFAAIPLALRGMRVGGQKTWKLIPAPIRKKAEGIAGKIGHSVGLAVKQNVQAYQLVRRRYQQIWQEKIKSSVFRKELLQKITPEEDVLLPFIREKALPKGVILNAGTKAKLEPIAKEVGNYLDDAHKFITENYGNDVNFVKDYIPHIWDIPKNRQKDVVNWFVTRNPHLKKRRIDTIKAGIEKFGLKPKYEKMSDVLKVYDEYRIKCVANVKFVNDLVKLQDTMGVKLVQRVDKAPANWTKIDHPVLAKGIYRGAVKEGKIPIIQKIPVAVHPDIADSVKTVLGKGWDKQTTSEFLGNAMRVGNKVNAFGKYMNLSLSLFHHVALAETAIASGIGPKAVRRFASDIGKTIIHPVKTWRAIKNRDYGAFRNLPLTKDAVSHGLQIGAIPDVQRNIIERSLLSMEQGLKRRGAIGKAIGLPVGVVRRGVELWNRALWDYYHTELKLMGYEKMVADSLKKYPQLPATAVKQEAAQFVNDTFGGQAWDLLLKSPKWRQSMHWLLLSPDWTLSTIRQALSPFGVGATSAITKRLREDLGTEFWKKAIVYFWGGLNLLNYGMTKAHTGEGRYMWQNAPGMETKLFVGYNPDGTEAYLRWGKQFRELPEFFIDPIQKFKGKASPVLRQIFAQVFPHPYFQKEIYGKKFVESAPGRVKELKSYVLPYSLQNIVRRGGAFSPLNLFTFAMPVSRGMTPFRTVELFKNAIEREDVTEVKRIRDAALRNNLDAQTLFKQAKASIKRDITFGAKKKAYRIYQDLMRLPPNERKEYYLRLRTEGKITDKLKEQLNKIILQQQKIKKQKAIYGVK